MSVAIKIKIEAYPKMSLEIVSNSVVLLEVVARDVQAQFCIMFVCLKSKQNAMFFMTFDLVSLAHYRRSMACTCPILKLMYRFY